MSDSPDSGIMAAPHLPWHVGACGAAFTPAPLFYSARHEQRAAEHEQRVGDRWTTTDRAEGLSMPQGWTGSTNHRFPPLALGLPVTRSTSTGAADAGSCALPCAGQVERYQPTDAAAPTLKPYWRRSPWWWWT